MQVVDRSVERAQLAVQRHYLGVRRAGEWPRNRAVQLRSEYLRRAWWLVLAEGAVLLAFTPLALLAPSWLRELLVGGWVVYVAWLLWHQVVVESGSSTRDMGAQAEQWTSNDLRALRRKGWRVVNHLVLRHWDIDHVAVGPGGLLVVQTKWVSDETGLRDLASWAKRIRADAQDVVLLLKPRLGKPPVHVLLVVWGPAARRDEPFPAEPVAGALVLPGRRLRPFLESIGGAAVPPEAVESAWKVLQGHVERRDASDLRASGPAPRPLQQHVRSLLLVLLAALSGFEGPVLALRWLHWPGFFVVVTGQVVLGTLAFKARLLRVFALAWLTAVASFCLLLAVAEIYAALR